MAKVVVVVYYHNTLITANVEKEYCIYYKETVNNLA